MRVFNEASAGAKPKFKTAEVSWEVGEGSGGEGGGEVAGRGADARGHEVMEGVSKGRERGQGRGKGFKSPTKLERGPRRSFSGGEMGMHGRGAAEKGEEQGQGTQVEVNIAEDRGKGRERGQGREKGFKPSTRPERGPRKSPETADANWEDSGCRRGAGGRGGRRWGRGQGKRGRRGRGMGQSSTQSG